MKHPMSLPPIDIGSFWILELSMEFQSKLSSLKPNTENVHGEPRFDPVLLCFSPLAIIFNTGKHRDITEACPAVAGTPP